MCKQCIILWILARESPRRWRGVEDRVWTDVLKSNLLFVVSRLSCLVFPPKLDTTSPKPWAQRDCNVHSLRVILYNRELLTIRFQYFIRRKNTRKINKAHINLLHRAAGPCKENANQTNKVWRKKWILDQSSEDPHFQHHSVLLPAIYYTTPAWSNKRKEKTIKKLYALLCMLPKKK